MYDPNLIRAGGDYAEAEQRRYRAECLVRCLESSLDRTDPENFDLVMQKLFRAREDLVKYAWEAWSLRVDLDLNRRGAAHG